MTGIGYDMFIDPQAREAILAAIETGELRATGRMVLGPQIGAQTSPGFLLFSTLERPGAPDGMKVDMEGNVYCTGPGGIWVLTPEGEHIGTILHRAVNMAWGGDDWTTMFFTGPTTINRIQLAIPGIPVPRGEV